MNSTISAQRGSPDPDLDKTVASIDEQARIAFFGLVRRKTGERTESTVRELIVKSEYSDKTLAHLWEDALAQLEDDAEIEAVALAKEACSS